MQDIPTGTEWIGPPCALRHGHRSRAFSTESTIDLAFGRPFRPGQSGNPGGRPKGLSRATRELVGEDGMAFGRAVVVDRPGPRCVGTPTGRKRQSSLPTVAGGKLLPTLRSRKTTACPCQSGAGGGGVPGQHPSASRRFAIRYRRRREPFRWPPGWPQGPSPCLQWLRRTA